jgi:hypothetical protein
MIGGMNNPIPRQVADMSMQMFSPKRQVVVDMVMVQMISAILIFLGILLFRNAEITQIEMTGYTFGVFISFFILTSIYQRIARFV